MAKSLQSTCTVSELIGPSSIRLSFKCLATSLPLRRCFSTSSTRLTVGRRALFRWLDGPGEAFRNPLPGSTNYLGAYNRGGRLRRENGDKKGSESSESQAYEPGSADLAERGRGEDADPSMPVPERQSDLKPFPTNPEFRSQSVLDEDLREEIYKRVADQEKSVKVVSAELGVEMSRIGAVVRLKAVERSWIKNNRTLAKPYANAILAMLPKTQYVPNQPRPHESINDLIVHPATTQQIFHPTSESRAFTRADAGRVFDPQLLPADERIPHPELIELERERLEGVKREDRIQRQRERTQRELRLKVEKQERMRQREKKMVHKVLPASQGGAGGRWLWRFQQINVHDAGKDGRGSKGVGWRYGLPHEDRKPGQIKIPTRA